MKIILSIQGLANKFANYHKDLTKVVTVLVQEKVLKYISKRLHPSFPNVVRNPIYNIEHEKLVSWMYIQLNSLIHGF